MTDLQHTLGAVIRRERRERQMTLKELAERSALSVVYLGEIERGKKYPSALVLERLAAALGLTVSDLLEYFADELRGVRQPAMTIGFLPIRRDTTQPAQTVQPHGNTGVILNMRVA